jgi:uncharacterized membrane protein YcaP (DUF421 family)
VLETKCGRAHDRRVFQLGTPAWQIAVRAAVVYLVLLAGLRLLGKREIGQISLADLVLILLIANAVQNAMTGPDTSLEGGLLAAAVLLVVNLGLTFGGMTFPWLGRALEGRRVALIVNGHVMTGRLRRVGVSMDELLTALHENQVSGPENVYEAYLEPDGQISVLPISAKHHVRYARPARRKRRHIRQLRKH